MEPGRILRRERRYLATLLDVSLRTIELWAERDRPEAQRAPGRPALSRRAKHLAIQCVHDEWLRQGRSVGWRTIEKALDYVVPTRLVQHGVSACKRCWRRDARVEAARRGVHTQVLARDAWWAQDATQVGRVDGRALMSEVVRDVATTKTSVPHVGKAASAEDVRRSLDRVRRERGVLPFVWSVDNGSGYRERRLERWLEEAQVMVLRSVPHVPQHNAFAERANGELKAEAELESDLPLRDPGDAKERIDAALRRLNELRRRSSRGDRTAAELDRELPRAEDLVDRATFWKTARYNIAQAVRGIDRPRARRLAERRATLETMEHFGLIRRTRGDGPLPAVKSESVL